MYSIGDLAQLGGVTPRMLRHYHELGVLVPAVVDDATGSEASIRRLENQMTDQPTGEVAVTTKRLPAVHLAVASGVSPSFASADIGPVIQPLYPRLLDALHAAKVEILGPSIAYYDDTEEGGTISTAQRTSPSGAPKCSSRSKSRRRESKTAVADGQLVEVAVTGWRIPCGSPRGGRRR